jgi:hypothetical protein
MVLTSACSKQVGEVPFFLGINYLKAMKASLEGDVRLEVLGKQSLTLLTADFPEDVNTICQNLWQLFDMGRGEEHNDGKIGKTQHLDDLSVDKEKLLTKKRILESTNFRKEQQFAALCKAAKSGDITSVVALARQGANLDMLDYDGRTAMVSLSAGNDYPAFRFLLAVYIAWRGLATLDYESVSWVRSIDITAKALPSSAHTAHGLHAGPIQDRGIPFETRCSPRHQRQMGSDPHGDCPPGCTGHGHHGPGVGKGQARHGVARVGTVHSSRKWRHNASQAPD